MTECPLCGKTAPESAMEKHHLFPRRYNGPDMGWNTRTMCATCHRALENIYDDAFWQGMARLRFATLVSEDGYIRQKEWPMSNIKRAKDEAESVVESYNKLISMMERWESAEERLYNINEDAEGDLFIGPKYE